MPMLPGRGGASVHRSTGLVYRYCLPHMPYSAMVGGNYTPCVGLFNRVIIEGSGHYGR